MKKRALTVQALQRQRNNLHTERRQPPFLEAVVSFLYLESIPKCFNASIIAASFSGGHCGTFAFSFFDRL